MLKLRYWASVLMALVFGLLIVSGTFMTSQRWWAAPTLVSVGIGINLQKEDAFRDEEAKLKREERTGITTLYATHALLCLAAIAVCAIIWQTAWWTFLTLAIGLIAFAAGYLLKEAVDEEAIAREREEALRVR